MNGSGVSLHSGDVLNVHMAYDGLTLNMIITDTVTSRIFNASWPIDIPATVAALRHMSASPAPAVGRRQINRSFELDLRFPFAINYGQGFTRTGLSLNGYSKYSVPACGLRMECRPKSAASS